MRLSDIDVVLGWRVLCRLLALMAVLGVMAGEMVLVSVKSIET